MNKITQVALHFQRILPALRILLELIIKDDELNAEVIEHQKLIFKSILNDKLFVENLYNNHEIGIKLKEHLDSLYDEVYESKKMINIIDGKLFADKGYRLKLLDYVTGLYQSFTDFVYTVIRTYKDEGLDARFIELQEVERTLYTLCFFFAAYKLILTLDKELKEEFKRTNNQPNPSTQLLINDIHKCFSFMGFVKKKYLGEPTSEEESANPNSFIKGADPELITNIFDGILTSLKYLDGSTPLKHGDDLGVLVNNSYLLVQKNIMKIQPIWSEKYNQLFKELNEDVLKQQQKIIGTD
jgi:hypothetical protein